MRKDGWVSQKIPWGCWPSSSSGVHQHNIAGSTRAAPKDLLRKGEVPLPVAPSQLLRLDLGDPEVLGPHRDAGYCAVANFEDDRRAGGRDFIQAVRAMNDKAAFQA